MDEVKLVEKSESEFSKVVTLGGLTNGHELTDRKPKFLFIELKNRVIGFVILESVLNIRTNNRYWILLNLVIRPEEQKKGLGKVSLAKVHSLMQEQWSINSYVISVSNYFMYKLIVQEFNNGVVDFHCPINDIYTVEEMKAEKIHLRQVFMEKDDVNISMIVSLNKDETEIVKTKFFLTENITSKNLINNA
jgi:hypothetical protein